MHFYLQRFLAYAIPVKHMLIEFSSETFPLRFGLGSVGEGETGSSTLGLMMNCTSQDLKSWG